MNNSQRPSPDPATVALLDQISAELKESHDRIVAALRLQVQQEWKPNDLLSYATGYLIAVEKFVLSDALPLLAYALVQTALTEEGK